MLDYFINKFESFSRKLRFQAVLIKGFHLTNSAYKLVLFYLSLALVFSLSSKSLESGFNIVFFSLSALFGILGFSGHLIAPLILEQQQKTQLPLSKIIQIYVENLPRSAKGAMALLSLLLLAVVIATLLISVPLLATNNQNPLENNPLAQTMIYLLTILTSAFTAFVPIYYSLNKQSILTSLVSSVKFAFKNFSFIIFIALLELLYLTPSILSANTNPVFEFLSILVTVYISILTISTTLIYYQKNS